MTDPHNGAPAEGHQRTPATTAEPDEIGVVGYCTCGVVGFVTAAAVTVLLYPLLVAITQPLHVLSSTMLVVIVVAIWLATWLSLEVVWEWQAERLSFDQSE